MTATRPILQEDAMPSTTPKRRIRVWFAALAVVAGLTTGCTSLDWNPDTPPAAGVQAQGGPVKARNILLVADSDGNGALLGSVVTTQAVDLAQVSVQPETAEGTRGDAVPLTVTARIPRDGAFQFDATNARVKGADLLPGRLAYVSLQFSDGTQLQLDAPVMSADSPDFKGVLG